MIYPETSLTKFSHDPLVHEIVVFMKLSRFFPSISSRCAISNTPLTLKLSICTYDCILWAVR